MADKEKTFESPSSPIAEYLRTVSDQVRWRQVRPAVVAELESHILDQAEAYQSAGMSVDEAAAEAVRQMGDPVIVGQALDAVHRPAPQWAALGFIAVMAAAGAAAQLYCNISLGTWWVDATKVIAFTLAGILLMVVLHLIDCQAFLARYALPVVAVVVGSACLVAAMSDFGAHSTRLAHSFHSVTLAFPFLLALLINRLRGVGWKGFAVCAAATVPMVLLTAFFGEVPQLLVMMVSAVFLMGYASAFDWFGVSRPKSAATLAAFVAAVAVLVSITGVFGEHFAWIAALGTSGQEPFGRFVAPFLGGVSFDGVGWLGTSIGAHSAAEQVLGKCLELSPFDCMPVVLAMILGFAPVALFCVGALLMAGWLAVRTVRQANRLYAMLGVSVSLVVVGEALFSLAPFLLGVSFSSSLFPFLTPGFHNVVLMSLVGIVLSGLRCENAPRTSETKPVRAGR